MIVAKISGGLGNQLFQYAKGRSYAIKQKKTLFLDLSWFENKHGYTPRKFLLNNFDIKAKIMPGILTKCLQTKMAKRLDKFVGGNYFYHPTLLDPIWEPATPLIIKKNILLEGFWADSSHFIGNWEQLRPEFEFKSNYSNKEYNILVDLINKSNSVSIHVRRGDYYLARELSFFGILSAEYYKRAVDFIGNNIESPRFFLFTDDENLNINEFCSLANSINVSKLVNNDIMEFNLMRLCKYNIIANSTYSWWAAFLNQYSGKIMIRPSKWYGDKIAQNCYEEGIVMTLPNSLTL